MLGGLWHTKRGTITKPSSDNGLFEDVFYLPQKPYNVLGTLRDQLTYPKTASSDALLTDERLKELLESVDLGYLLQTNFDEVRTELDDCLFVFHILQVTNWESKLSLGETQRLAMARLFYHKPKFAILDECTSGVTTAMEERLYRLCKEYKITCITIRYTLKRVSMSLMVIKIHLQPPPRFGGVSRPQAGFGREGRLCA